MKKHSTYTAALLLLVMSGSAYSDAFKPSSGVSQERIEQLEQSLSQVRMRLEDISRKEVHAPAEKSVEEIQAELISQGLITGSDEAEGSRLIGVLNGKKLKEKNSELFFGEGLK